MKTAVVFDRLDETQREVHEKIERVLQDGALETQALAQQLAPVDTGRLRASIEFRKVGNLTFEVFTVVNYAGFVEYGTVHMSSQPFMRPAHERNYQQVIAGLVKSLSTL